MHTTIRVLFIQLFYEFVAGNQINKVIYFNIGFTMHHCTTVCDLYDTVFLSTLIKSHLTQIGIGYYMCGFF